MKKVVTKIFLCLILISLMPFSLISKPCCRTQKGWEIWGFKNVRIPAGKKCKDFGLREAGCSKKYVILNKDGVVIHREQ